MNKQQLIKRVADTLKENDIKKPISIPKHVFHISDDEGNHKDFAVKKTDKTAIYTRNDVEAIIDTCLYVIEKSIEEGEPISIHGFGTLGLNYRKPRTMKQFGTGEEIYVEGRYVPKFNFGSELRMAAKMYELSKAEEIAKLEASIEQDDSEEDDI